MLSGIGNKDHLSSFGIKTLVDLPAVGTNLQDHVFLGNSWLVNSNFTLDDLHRNATLAAEQLQIWEVNGTGLIGLPPTNQFAWLRVDSSVFEELNATDPSAGTTSANFEMIISVRTLWLTEWSLVPDQRASETGQLCLQARCAASRRTLPDLRN